MSDLVLLTNLFDSPLFQGAMTHPLPSRNDHGKLSVDFKENENNYELHADLPGYNKDDIHVHVEEGVLSVEASKSETKTEEEPGKYYFKERFSGKVHRSFRLPVNANSDAAEVSYTDGVLAVAIPKLENVGAKKLTIA